MLPPLHGVGRRNKRNGVDNAHSPGERTQLENEAIRGHLSRLSAAPFDLLRPLAKGMPNGEWGIENQRHR
jgi:hypothetical protein